MAKKKAAAADKPRQVKQKEGNAGDLGKMGRAGELGAIGSHTRTDRDEDYPEPSAGE